MSKDNQNWIERDGMIGPKIEPDGRIRVPAIACERDRIGEIQDRLRRIETRLTKWMESCGFDTQVKKPVFKQDSIHIPSMDVRYRDILSVIPKDYQGTIDIYHAGMVVGLLLVEP